MTRFEQSVGAACVRAAIGSFVLAACLLVSYGHDIASGGHMLGGDMFDSRIADALELRWSRAFARSEIWNRPHDFDPIEDTLGYNDGYSLFGVVVAVFRPLGFDLFVADELAGVTVPHRTVRAIPLVPAGGNEKRASKRRSGFMVAPLALSVSKEAS